jgi:hypothetical protein
MDMTWSLAGVRTSRPNRTVPTLRESRPAVRCPRRTIIGLGAIAGMTALALIVPGVGAVGVAGILAAGGAISPSLPPQPRSSKSWPGHIPKVAGRGEWKAYGSCSRIPASAECRFGGLPGTVSTLRCRWSVRCSRREACRLLGQRSTVADQLAETRCAFPQEVSIGRSEPSGTGRTPPRSQPTGSS